VLINCYFSDMLPFFFPPQKLQRILFFM